MKIFTRTLITLFLLASILLNNVYAAVNARLEQNMVYTGDPITLLIETNLDTNTKPDLSILETDFEVLNTSTSSQVNILNGQRSYKKTWSVNLQAKREGEITIPEITIGSEKTNALKVIIQEVPPEIKAETSKHVFIESSVDMEGNETYVQQQIPYKVKLFYDATMQSAEIQTPSIENAVMEQLGDDRRYQTRRNGKTFTVVEKSYVISPEKSGTLRIPPAVISGRISLTNTETQNQRQKRDSRDIMSRFFNDLGQDPFFRNDPFADEFFMRRNRGPSKPFSIKSEAIDVTVNSVPNEFTGNSWLPAEQLVIVDSWAKSPAELKVGEPVTRTITLQAKGLASSQIPDIELPIPEGIKSYPEAPVQQTRTDGSTVIGTQQMTLSYIPNKSGPIVFPPINIDWWDVNNKQQKTATLPAWNLNIAKGEFSETDSAPASEAISKSTDEELKDEQLSSKAPLIPPKKESLFNTDSWTSLFWMLFTLIVGAALLWFARRYLRSISTKNTKHEAQLLKSELISACESNDKQTVARLLIKYAQIVWEDDSIQNLRSLANAIDSNAELILDLENSLYASGSSNWQGKELRQLIEQDFLNKKLTTTKEIKGEDGLTPLYPS